MPVDVRFRCSGCDAEAWGTDRIRWEFRSFSGRTYGVGGVCQVKHILDVVPEGWVAYDPYTYLCYCPKCIAEIWPDEEPAPTTPNPDTEKHE